ncbi:MAG: glycosyltransferase [Thermoflexales bacterium]
MAKSGPITLLTSGTRGDVQPYVALGLGLRAAGHAVRLAAPEAFRSFVAPSGLPFAGFEGNPSELLARPDAQAALNDSGNLIRTVQASLRYARDARPVYRRMLANAWEACQGSRALLIGLPTVWGAHIAEALGIPIGWAFLQPFARTRAHPSALLPARMRLGGGGNALTHRIVEQAMWLPWRGIVNTWRTRVLGLRAAPLLYPYAEMYGPNALAVYGYSPAVAPRPADWPAGHVVTGYWFWPDDMGWQPPVGLDGFLAGAPLALSLSFGTAALRDPDSMLPLVLRAVALSGMRAVVSAPPAWHAGLARSARVYPIEGAPHAWLFARVAGAVHHGGAGTTGYSLRAGLPTAVIPHATDQFYWGDRISALGAGPPLLARHALTAEVLAAALRQLAGDAPMRARAAAIGEAIRAEDGVARAVEALGQL